MRIIQAGVGGFGNSWIYTVRDCNGFEHVALVDPSPEALHRAGEIAGVPPERRFSSIEDALALVEADGVIDCTPASCHFDTTSSALLSDLHVLVEKPLSDTLRHASQMVQLAEHRKRILMVTQQYRYQDAPRTLRKLIAQGAIGTIDHMVVEFQIQGLLFGWRQRMEHPFLMDMAIHHFDLMRYLLGQNAMKVQAQTWNPPVSNTKGDLNAFVWIEFEGGTRINYTGTYASPGTDTGWNGRWVITGSKGTLVWNPRDEWGPIRYFAQRSDPNQYTEMHFFTPLAEPWGEVIWPEHTGAVGHTYDLLHWRACCETGIEPETSGKDNLNTLALTMAAVQAADTGETVAVSSLL